MVQGITFNPGLTTNARGTFSKTSEGYIQGNALPDPAIRNALAGGVLANSETLPMWGGVAISENIPPASLAAGARNALQGSIFRASGLGSAGAALSLTGFSVFDQAHHMINTPQSEVPLAASGMGVHFYRLGSGARIPVAMDPSLVDLEGDIITSLVSWDFVTQRLVPYVAAYNQIAITSQVRDPATGIVTVTTAANHPFTPGKEINIANAGAGFAGPKEVLTVADATHFTYQTPVQPVLVTPANPAGVILAGGGALPVRVLDVQLDNSMTVEYDPVTGYANWNRNGSTAIILI